MGFEPTTRSRRVVGSDPMWDSDFFRVYVSPRIYMISCYCCCYYFSVSSDLSGGWSYLAFEQPGPGVLLV